MDEDFYLLEEDYDSRLRRIRHERRHKQQRIEEIVHLPQQEKDLHPDDPEYNQNHSVHPIDHSNLNSTIHWGTKASQTQEDETGETAEQEKDEETREQRLERLRQEETINQGIKLLQELYPHMYPDKKMTESIISTKSPSSFTSPLSSLSSNTPMVISDRYPRNTVPILSSKHCGRHDHPKNPTTILLDKTSMTPFRNQNVSFHLFSPHDHDTNRVPKQEVHNVESHLSIKRNSNAREEKNHRQSISPEPSSSFYFDYGDQNHLELTQREGKDVVGKRNNRKPFFLKDDSSSSSSENIVELARQIQKRQQEKRVYEEKQKRKQDHQTVGLEEMSETNTNTITNTNTLIPKTPTFFRAKAGYQCHNDNDDDDDDDSFDVVEEAKRIQQRQRQRECELMEQQAIGETIQQECHQNDRENHPNVSKQWRNPIQEWKKEQEDLLQSCQKNELHSTMDLKYQSITQEDKDTLWDDSSNEEHNHHSETKKAKSRKRPPSNNIETHDSKVRMDPKPEKRLKEIDEGQNKSPRPIDHHTPGVRENDMSSVRTHIQNEDDNEEILRSQLKPNFTDPKLGPPSDLIPLILTRLVPNNKRNVEDSTKDNHLSKGRFNDLITIEDHVPASINRYLQEYQREGIKFMYSVLSKGIGVILGDDMGLGKTVQVISLLAAFQKKTGTNLDAKVIKMREASIQQEMRRKQIAADRSLLLGENWTRAIGNVVCDPVKFTPTLIIVPPSVIGNWKREFDTWGHFAVAQYQDTQRSNALDSVRTGINDILISGRALFLQKDDFDVIKTIPWKLVIVDEFHEYKSHGAQCYTNLKELRDRLHCPILGMTGTLMSNSHRELWNLVDLVSPNLLGSWKVFRVHVARPITLARTKDAKDDVLALGAARGRDLASVLTKVYLKRNKADVLKDSLTSKDEKVVFCPLSEVQRKLYERLLALPDFKLVRFAKSPCECGVNRNFFIGYRQLRTKKEKIAYQKQHSKELKSNMECCHRIPHNPRRYEEGEAVIDPDAVLWRTFHPNEEACVNCPFCIMLPLFEKLYKVCSHPALLQLKCDPENIEEGLERQKAERALEFAKVALTPDILELLPGKSYFRGDTIMDNQMMLSGKMQALDYFLNMYARRGDRVLVFSHSTTTLDIMQHYLKGKGYSYSRLDGSTPTKKRQQLIDEFQKDSNLFVFLISTRAGGLGLNLTAANKVIIFDVNWNPSYDEQAQDRAFRIGQLRDVEVVRFVARGTIEELKYARQIYKIHLKKQTLDNVGGSAVPQPARIFRGVDKYQQRKGELFGVENLLNYKDGSFMADIWKAYGKDISFTTSATPQVVDVSSVKDVLSSISPQQMESFGNSEYISQDRRGQSNLKGNQVKDDESLLFAEKFSHEDFLRDDRGGCRLMPGDIDFDEEVGGETQAVQIACEMAVGKLVESGDDNCGQVLTEEKIMVNDRESRPVNRSKSRCRIPTFGKLETKSRYSVSLPSYLTKGQNK